MLSEDFAYLIGKFGQPSGSKPLSAAAIEAYRGKLPDVWLNFWQECGLGLWLNGKFQFCYPETYVSIVEDVCGNDPQFDAARTHLVGFSAFGELHLWHETNDYLYVNLPLLTARARASGQTRLPADRAIVTALTVIGGKSAGDLADRDGVMLFDRCRNKLGELSLGQCFGFVPALGLGGPAILDNVQRLSALEHFAILASIGRPRLMDYAGGNQTFIRNIG